MYLNPGQLVAYVFEGAAEAGRILDLDKSTVSRWQSTHVPASMQVHILTKARELNIKLTPRDIIYGRNVPASKVQAQRKRALTRQFNK